MSAPTFLRPIIVLLFLFACMISTAARGQVPAGNAAQDQQDMQDQLRQNFQTIMQNMQAKGIDPRQFFDQMQRGVDPAEIQKQMIDQGILDPQMAAQMQSTSRKLSTSRMREQLQCTDEEWATLDPMIQKVTSASGALGLGGGAMRMGAFTATPSQAVAELSKAKRALHAAIIDANTPADQFKVLLQNVRDARTKVREELASARSDLLGVLTVRQEGVLTSMGIIE